MKDKSAIIKDAQKFTAKGQLDKAISEWKKLLDEGKDGNVHNIIGDLYLKKGAETDSIESYTKAAEIFKKDGFFPKAKALYKKILHIVPNDVNALIALAKLDAERGLTVSSVENYLKAAEVFKRDSNIEKTMQVVEKILELSPSDVSIKMKVADLYIRSGMREKAMNEYIEIATIHLNNADCDKAQIFFNKVCESEPSDVRALLGLFKVEKTLENIDQAFEYLNTALSHHPDDREALLSCSKFAIDQNKIDLAKKTILEAINVHPDDVEFKKLMGTIHLSENALEQAWEDLLPFIDEALENKNWEEARGFLMNFREQYPEPVIQRLVTLYKASGETDNLVPEMKNLASMHNDAGAQNEALQIYKELLDFCPGDETIIHEINALESELGVAPPPVDVEDTADQAEELAAQEQPVPDDSAASIEDLLSPEALEEDDLLLQDSEPSHAETSLPDDDMVSPPAELDMGGTTDEREESVIESGETREMSPEEFAEKKAEADFFAQQGITDEALRIYEKLAAAFPENNEIKEEIARLDPRASKTRDIEVQKISRNEPDIMEGQFASPDVPALELSEEVSKNDHHELHDIFNQFQENDEDYEYHYKRGKELKQKGRLDEAIEEFQRAAKDPQKELRNTSVLALCYMEKGDYQHAIQEFSRVIEKISPADSGYFNVKYELARAYMGNKDYNKALKIYSEIQEQNPDFKDVAKTIDELKSLTAGTGIEQNARKDRVSYI
jgi:tetratricopeptide (TPR) repeat protein